MDDSQSSNSWLAGVGGGGASSSGGSSISQSCSPMAVAPMYAFNMRACVWHLKSWRQPIQAGKVELKENTTTTTTTTTTASNTSTAATRMAKKEQQAVQMRERLNRVVSLACISLSVCRKTSS